MKTGLPQRPAVLLPAAGRPTIPARAHTSALRPAQWARVEAWLAEGRVPAALQNGGHAPSDALRLPSDPDGAAILVAAALSPPSGGPCPRALAAELVPAMPMGPDDWRVLGAVMEVELTRNREGLGPARIGACPQAAREILAAEIAARRLMRHGGGAARPRAAALLASSISAAGPLIDWVLAGAEARRRRAMAVLTGRHGLSAPGAAGLTASLEAASGLLPQRVDGAPARDPRAPRVPGGGCRRFCAAEIAARRRGLQGPPRAGVGLAGWSSPEARRGLFGFAWRGIPAGPGVLYHMDMQLAYLTHELRARHAGLWERLRDPERGAALAARDVLVSYARPDDVLAGPALRPDGDRLLERVAARRARLAEAALAAHVETAR